MQFEKTLEVVDDATKATYLPLGVFALDVASGKYFEHSFPNEQMFKYEMFAAAAICGAALFVARRMKSANNRPAAPSP